MPPPILPLKVICTSLDEDLKSAFTALFKMLNSSRLQVIRIAVLGTDVFVQQILRQLVAFKRKRKL